MATLAAAVYVAATLACSEDDAPSTAAPGPPAAERVTEAATATALATARATTPLPAPAVPTPTPTPTPAPLPRLIVPDSAVEVDRGTTDRREIALTFNCASRSGPTAEILRVLREEGVRTTWFIVGVWAREHEELTKQIAAEHEVANHSWAHPDYRELTDAEIVADMEQLESFMLALTGQSTKPLWRAPSGARNDRALRAAATAGWPVHVFWTIGRDAAGPVTGDNGDWRGIPAAEVYANMQRAIALGSGVILVSHCDSEATAQVLRDAIRAARAADMRIVTVSELLRP